jgi:pyruvate ferredoxin oxidoreductase beta subunit
MTTIHDLAKAPERLTGGHRLCSGCGAPICVRQILANIKEPVVVINATGCLEVSTSVYPFSAWNIPWIHSAFENAAATASGIVEAYNALRRKGKISRETKFVVFGGDGSSYDIGLQSLSGALERGHKFLYVCYNNEAYANTGDQRSGATPQGGATTTTPPGKISYGKVQKRKNLTEIVAAHNIPFAAQTSIHLWPDIASKVEKAMAAPGPSFINILSPCQLFWGFPPNLTIKMAKLAVDTGLWPLYEIENGKYKINYTPATLLPMVDWIKSQVRFKHLLLPENQPIVEEIQKEVYKQWAELKAKVEATNK